MMPQNQTKSNPLPAEGILLIDKPRGKTSFSLVGILRKRLGVRKIGHAGTLDPFATGVMVLLIGKRFTRLSDYFLCHHKEYIAEVRLGIATDTHDCEGKVLSESSIIPTAEQVAEALKSFQGEIMQIPPMFSAKKQGGKKLYELARKGKEVERPPVAVKVDTTLLSYEYPYISLHVKCSKGTYIRAIARDLGDQLGCGGHLTTLQRTRSGAFDIKDCLDGSLLWSPDFPTEEIETRLLNIEIT